MRVESREFFKSKWHQGRRIFRTAYAVRFDRPARNGRNKACLLECADLAGVRIDVIAKFTACESGPTGLIREALAAFFAADLGLHVPEPILVEVPPRFSAGASFPEVDHMMATSSRYAFGSAALPAGYMIVAPALPVKGPMLQRAADIFAFDTFVANGDRHPRNPNCLVRGEDLAVIDHDLAFLMDAILFWKSPWVLGGGESLADPEKHIFWHQIRAQKLDFTRLGECLKAITDARLDEYVAALPDDWKLGNQAAQNTVQYIKDLRQNADDAFSELQRVLA